MIDAAFEGLTHIMQPWPLFLMLAGIIGCSVFAALPGIGSLLLMTVVLPFSFTLDPYAAIALLLGIGAVSNTANTFPSVLLSVPGSAGSQATIVDGYPMAGKGEAQRAFGAAFTASAMGGLCGAAVLLISLPVLRPIVLSFGSPEFLILVIWGLSAVGVLSGNAPLKGLGAAILGLLVSTVGVDGKTAIERFDFGNPYFWDGISIILVGLGLFAAPEMITLAVRRTAIAERGSLGAGRWQGMKDALQHWWLVIRCSVIGVWIGVLPGLGSTVADWFAYAHAAQTEKNTENFGKGDVRGVIAPESSNNAKEGGALIPTIAFGIPGSVSFALMLTAFTTVGITPGSAMLDEQLPYTMAMIWVLVIANLVAASLAIGASGVFARISFMPFYLVVPMTLVLCVSSSFSTHFSWLDLIIFLVFSCIGYLMKMFGWPRPPLLVAVVLGGQMERYLWLSQARYGWWWLLEPGVLALLVLVILTLAIPLLRRWRKRRAETEEASESIGRSRLMGNAVFCSLLIALLAVGAWIATGWWFRSALIVYVLAGVGIPLLLLQIGLDLRGLSDARQEHAGAAPAQMDLGREASDGEAHEPERTLQIAGWLIGLVLGTYGAGFYVAIPVFVILYVLAYGGKWREAAGLTVVAVAFIYVVFDLLLNVSWPRPALLELFG